MDPPAHGGPPEGGGRAAAQRSPTPDLDEALVRARRLLHELNARLTYFAGDVRVAYLVDGFGELRGLRQGGYRLDLPRDPLGAPLSLTFACQGQGPELVHQVEGSPAVVEQHREYVSRHGLRFKTEGVYADAHASRHFGPAPHVAFHIAPFVPVSLTLDVDRRAGLARLTAWNLERLGRVSYPLRPAMVAEDLFAELFKAITRQPNRLNAALGFEVPPEVRDRLRERIYTDARRKALELAGARALARPPGLIARLIGKRGPNA
jgi:hypothetical protein